MVVAGCPAIPFFLFFPVFSFFFEDIPFFPFFWWKFPFFPFFFTFLAPKFFLPLFFPQLWLENVNFRDFFMYSEKNSPAARFCQSISLYLSSQLLLRAYHYSWTTWYLDGGQVWDQAHCGWRRMYFYDCLVVVNRDRVLFHNDTNLLSFFEFCHTSMPGGATLFSKTWLTKQKHNGMTFGEWGDQASSEGPHKLFCECCKKHLTCGNWGTTSILQHIMKPGHILNHKDRTDTSQKRFI